MGLDISEVFIIAGIILELHYLVPIVSQAICLVLHTYDFI